MPAASRGIALKNQFPGRNRVYTFGGSQYINFRMNPGAMSISGSDITLEGLCGFFLNQIDGAAAKSTASHSSANQAPLLCGDLDHNVELSTADFVIITQAAV